MSAAFNFLSYIQNRYPCSTKSVQGFQIPEYDGLCLDINSILSANIYSDDKLLSDEEIFVNVTDHIDFLFRSVNPKTFIFIAFDGVPPDAKLHYLKNKILAIKNSIRNVYEENEFAKASQDHVDMSYFVTGTSFTSELILYLKHFVAYKISTDSKWQKLKIFISGPEIPGESKIKIAQFIRYYKAQNQSKIMKHCLYTFDADLLLLGLSTHEPYISIIQNRSSYLKIKDSTTPEEADFLITHLSLIREYLELEFSTSLQGKLKFEYDFEKVLDDWILIGILISTYSLPYLSHLNVENGALSVIFNTYLKTLQSLNGCIINEFGELQVNRLQKLMIKLSKIEMHTLQIKDGEILDTEKIKHNLRSINVDKVLSESDKKLPVISTEIRNDHYRKIESESNSDFEHIVPIAVSDYIKSIQWHLKYYYGECCSWSWVYSHAEAPLICDMHNLDNIKLSFDIGKPLNIPILLSSVLPSSNIQNSLKDVKEENDTNRRISLLVYSESKAEALTEQYGLTSFLNHTDLRFIKLEDLAVSKETILKKSIATFDNTLGFPTFNHISSKLHLQLEKRCESTDKDDCEDSNPINDVVTLNVNSHISGSFQEISANVLGKAFFGNWPYLELAYVNSITNFKNEIAMKMSFSMYDKKNTVTTNLSEYKIKLLRQTSENIERLYDSIGISIGSTKLLVGVYLQTGKRYIYEPPDKMRLKSMHNLMTTYIPYQILSVSAFSIMTEKRYLYLHNVFSTSNLCFMIRQPHYGSLGEIKSLMPKDNKISIRLNVVNESKDYVEAFFKTNNLYNFEILEYLDINIVAEKLNMKASVLCTICESVYVMEKKSDSGITKHLKHDVGLKLIGPTNNQEEQTLAYAIKGNASWLFSKKAVELINDYKLEFPEIIQMVAKNPATNQYDASECFKENTSASLKNIDKWLQKSRKEIKKVQKDILKFILNNLNTLNEIVTKNNSVSEEIDVDVLPEVLFKPGTLSGLAPPDEKARHYLLDRIICAKENFTVPFGLKGTIINIICSDNGHWYNIYEVIFDSPFPGGLKLYGSLQCNCYRLRLSDFINISYGERNKGKCVNDPCKEKKKMKQTIKIVNENVQRRKDKRSEQSREKEKVHKFSSKCSKLGFTAN